MLASQREKIDQLDRELVRLLEERMETVTQIAEIKVASGIPVLDAGREVLVIDKVSGYVVNQEYCESIVEVYHEILASSKKYQAALVAAEK